MRRSVSSLRPGRVRLDPLPFQNRIPSILSGLVVGLHAVDRVADLGRKFPHDACDRRVGEDDHAELLDRIDEPVAAEHAAPCEGARVLWRLSLLGIDDHGGAGGRGERLGWNAHERIHQPQ